jgi:hypothetical protein
MIYCSVAKVRLPKLLPNPLRMNGKPVERRPHYAISPTLSPMHAVIIILVANQLATSQGD